MGWEGAGVTPGRKPGCAQLPGRAAGKQRECAACSGPLSPAKLPDAEHGLALLLLSCIKKQISALQDLSILQEQGCRLG